MPNRRIAVKRFCYGCGNSETYRSKDGRSHWVLNHDKDSNVLCSRCDSRHRRNPISNANRSPESIRKWNMIHNHRRLEYKGRSVLLAYEPRINVCNLCRAVVPFDCRQTQLHHEQYDDSNPLAYTLEVCPACHGRYFENKGQFKRK